MTALIWKYDSHSSRFNLYLMISTKKETTTVGYERCLLILRRPSMRNHIPNLEVIGLWLTFTLMPGYGDMFSCSLYAKWYKSVPYVRRSYHDWFSIVSSVTPFSWGQSVFERMGHGRIVSTPAIAVGGKGISEIQRSSIWNHAPRYFSVLIFLNVRFLNMYPAEGEAWSRRVNALGPSDAYMRQ